MSPTPSRIEILLLKIQIQLNRLMVMKKRVFCHWIGISKHVLVNQSIDCPKLFCADRL